MPSTRLRRALPLALLPLALAAGAAAQDVERGRYLATIMDCGGCHTGGVLMGQPDPNRYLGGSEVGFAIPGFGIFYPPNLTPHPSADISGWTADDIIRAVRTGVRPDGRVLAPVMPYHAYAALTDADAADLAAFIQSLPPVDFRAPAPVGADQQPTAPYLSVVIP